MNLRPAKFPVKFAANVAAFYKRLEELEKRMATEKMMKSTILLEGGDLDGLNMECSDHKMPWPMAIEFDIPGELTEDKLAIRRARYVQIVSDESADQMEAWSEYTHQETTDHLLAHNHPDLTVPGKAFETIKDYPPVVIISGPVSSGKSPLAKKLKEKIEAAGKSCALVDNHVYDFEGNYKWQLDRAKRAIAELAVDVGIICVGADGGPFNVEIDPRLGVSFVMALLADGEML